MSTVLWLLAALGLLASAQAYTVDGSTDTMGIGNPGGPGEILCNNVACNKRSSVCEAGKCVCKPNSKGAGGLGCFRGDWMTCSAVSDPSTKNFQNEFYEIATPCRYRITAYQLFKPNRKERQTKCAVKVHATNVRFDGKLFIGTFEARFEIQEKGRDVYTVTFRGLGEVDLDSKEYKFQRRVRIGAGHNKWFELDEKDVDFDYEFTADRGQKRLILSVPECGYKQYFRPANPSEGRHQSRLPGFSFGVDPSLGELKWISPESSTCMAPEGEGSSMSSLAQPDQLTLTEAAARMVYSTSQQLASYLPDECHTLRKVAGDCPADRSGEATRVCMTLVTASKFMGCFSAGDDQGAVTTITGLLNDCLTSICTQNSQLCEQTKTKVTTTCPNKLAGVKLATHQCSFITRL